MLLNRVYAVRSPKQRLKNWLMTFGAEENYLVFSLPLALRERIAEVMLKDIAGVIDVCEIGSHFGEQTNILLSRASSKGIKFRSLFLIEPGQANVVFQNIDRERVSLLRSKLEESMTELQQSRFDLIYAVEAMESVNNYDKLIPQLRSRLRRGGKLAFTMNKTPTGRRCVLTGLFAFIVASMLFLNVGLVEATMCGVIGSSLLFLGMVLRKVGRILSPIILLKAIFHSVAFSAKSGTKMDRRRAERFAEIFEARVTSVDDVLFGLWIFEIFGRK